MNKLLVRVRATACAVLAGAMLFAAQAPAVARDEPADAAADAREALYGFLHGTYWLVGKEPDGERTYLGRVILTARGDHLDMVRVIEGKSGQGQAWVEPLVIGEGEILRLRYTENGVAFEGAYLWQGDPDNQARLSGYVYRADGRSTLSPGMEALFFAAGP